MDGSRTLLVQPPGRLARGGRRGLLRALLALQMCVGALAFSVSRATATPSVSVTSITPNMTAQGAGADGTLNTIFTISVNVTPAAGSGIVAATVDFGNGMPAQPIGAGNFTFHLAGYAWVNVLPNAGLFWQTAVWHPGVTVWAQSNEAQNNQARTTRTAAVAPSGREVLIPVDAAGNPDVYSQNRDGLAVAPQDDRHDGDGSSSSTYTFRVLYRHPLGLPPRAPDAFDVRDDVWRFPVSPDVTIPTGLAPSPGSVKSGVLLLLDTDLTQDGTVAESDPNDPTHLLARRRAELPVQDNAPRPINPPYLHYMVPAPGVTSLTPADFMQGVIYQYVIMPTSHEVSLGIPTGMYSNRVSFAQNAIALFGQILGFQGVRYLDGDYRLNKSGNSRVPASTYAPNGRADPLYGNAFMALSAGRHAFTYGCTSDQNPNYGTDDFGNLVGEVTRFADYSAPSAGGSTWPARLFPEVSAPAATDPSRGWGQMQFQKPLVNPGLDADMSTVPGSVPPYEIRIPTPAKVMNPLRPGKPSPEVLLAGDPATGQVVSTRALQAETIRFQIYYSQSDNVAPLSVSLLLYKQDPATGTFPPTATQTLTLSEDAPEGPYNTPSGKPFYKDVQLAPGQYRYSFRANDGTRTAEWPGDSQAGTSLTLSLNTSHVANTVRVNYPPVLTAPQVTPNFGSSGTTFVYQVTYTDADNDAPRHAYLFIGTNTDTISAGGVSVDPMNPNNTQISVTGASYPYQTNTYTNGELVLARLPVNAFQIVSNTGNTFTVADPGGILRSNAQVADTLELRRRVEMNPAAGSGTNYAGGVTYQFSTATDSTLKLAEGTRTYHFQFMDNWQTAAKPEDGETVRLQNGINDEIQGPVVQANSPPSLTSGSVTPTIGNTQTQYTFAVRYSDIDNDRPTQMQVIIDPNLNNQVYPAAGSSLAIGTMTERTLRPAALPAPAWTDGQWVGKVLKIVAPGTARDGKLYVISNNTGNNAGGAGDYTLTLFPGTNLLRDGVLNTDQFVILDIIGDTRAMQQLNPADTLYTDGADFYLTTQLPLGDHTFLFRTSDGYNVRYDSTVPGQPFTPMTGPTVRVNNIPTLMSQAVVPIGAGATISALDTTSVTISTPAANFAANALVGKALQVLVGGTPVVRSSFAVTANTATAGGLTTVTVNGNPQMAGVLATDLFQIGETPVAPGYGPSGTTFTWDVVYTDADNDSPETGPPAYIRLVIDGQPVAGLARIDATNLNFRGGVLYRYVGTLPTGTHSYYFEANDGSNAVRFPAVGAFTGPIVNDPPVLSTPTLTPATGTSATSYRFEVTYTDSDNDAPPAGYPQVVVTDPSGKPLDPGNGQPGFTMTPVAIGPYTAGVLYRFDMAATPTLKLPYGLYTYEFRAAPVVPGVNPGSARIGPTNGPAINNAPTLTNPTVAFQPDPTLPGIAAGSSQGRYAFDVVYTDQDNNPPANNQLLVTIKRPDNTVLGQFPMTPAPNQGTNYTTGVHYQYVSMAGQLSMPGTYSFWADASDAVQAPMVSLSASTLLTPTSPPTSGPVINNPPTLTQLNCTPKSAVRGTQFTFTAVYTDVDNQAPVTPPMLTIYKPSAGVPTQKLTAVPMTGDSKQPSAGQTFTATVQLTDADNANPYRFYITTSDGVDSVVSPAGADSNGGLAAAGPIVAGPVLTQGAVDPTKATKSATYTFRVMYTHAASTPPTSVQLRLLRPNGQEMDLNPDPAVTLGTMTTEDTDPAKLPSPGWLYTYSIDGASLTDSGTYHYQFMASDGTTPAYQTDLADGPTTLDVVAPDMSGESVNPTPTDNSVVIYRVTYKQAQNLKPTYIKLVVDDVVSSDPKYLMAQENASAIDMTAGVVFAATLPRPSGTTVHHYYFLVKVPGSTGPDVDGTFRYPTAPNEAVGPNAPTLLEVPTGGSVTPSSGTTATAFTFQVKVTDPDAVADPTVFVLVGNKKLALTKAAGGDVHQGVIYSVTTVPGVNSASALPAGALVHSFIADDGSNTTRLPVTGTLSGPSVLAQTSLNASLSLNQVNLDGMSSVQVVGALDPPVPSAEISVVYTCQDAPSNTFTQTAVADGQGRFTSDPFIPFHSGTWSVVLRYEGNGAGVGAGQQQLTLTVTPSTFVVPQGVSLMGLPVTPDTDLTAILGTTGYQLAVWNGSGYNYGPGAGFATPGIGQGFWIRADRALTASAVGAMVNHSQDQVIPIKAGWNQIANPFLTPISWGDVKLQAQGTTMTLADGKAAGLCLDHAWTFDAGSGQYVLVHATANGARRDVGGWQAVWFKSNVDGALVFLAPASRSHAPVAPTTRKRTAGADDDWEIQLVAKSGTRSDSFNYAGVSPQGRANDLAGLESPPAFSDYVDLYFTGPSNTGRYATDYRAPSAGEQAWDIAVETDRQRDPVTITTPNLSRVPKTLDVLLEDVDAGGKRSYLRTAGGYTYNPGSSSRRRFRLIVRPHADGALAITGITMTPSRAGTAIGFSVTQEATVTVEVLSPSMRTLKRVADRQAAGQTRSTVVWDGTRDDGVRLPAGLYMVQITATTPEGQAVRTVKPYMVTR